MGRFVNPNNSAFQVALNSQIYVDKTGLIAYSHGEYLNLGKKIGTFGYSVRKKKK